MHIPGKLQTGQADSRLVQTLVRSRSLHTFKVRSAMMLKSASSSCLLECPWVGDGDEDTNLRPKPLDFLCHPRRPQEFPILLALQSMEKDHLLD
jgi:hypothetical protein